MALLKARKAIALMLPNGPAMVLVQWIWATPLGGICHVGTRNNAAICFGPDLLVWHGGRLGAASALCH